MPDTTNKAKASSWERHFGFNRVGFSMQMGTLAYVCYFCWLGQGLSVNLVGNGNGNGVLICCKAVKLQPFIPWCLMPAWQWVEYASLHLQLGMSAYQVGSHGHAGTSGAGHVGISPASSWKTWGGQQYLACIFLCPKLDCCKSAADFCIFSWR